MVESKQDSVQKKIKKWEERPQIIEATMLSVGTSKNQRRTDKIIDFTLFKGILKLSPEEHKVCYIRTTKGPESLIKRLMRNEITCLENVKKAKVAVKVFGYFFEKEEQNILSYSLFYKYYPRTLADVQSLSIPEKTSIMFETLKTFSYMFEHNIWVGLISPESLYIDSYAKVRIGNLTLAHSVSSFKQNFRKVQKYFNFLDDKFISPEIGIAKQCFQEEISIKCFDPIRSDCFSIGLCLLRMFVSIEHGLNIIDVQPVACANKEINNSANNVIILTRTQLEFKSLQKKVAALSNHIKACISQIDFEHSYIIEGLLTVTYRERYALEEINTLIISVKSDSVNLATAVRYHIPNKKIKRMIKEFIEIAEITNLKDFPPENNKELFFEMIVDWKRNYESVIDDLEKKYYSKSVQCQIDVIEALSVFFRIFLEQINDSDKFVLFCTKIRKQSLCNYSQTFNYLLGLSDEFTKDFVSSIMMKFEINNSIWEFIFLRNIESEGFENAPLEKYPTLVNEFFEILHWDVLEQVYSPFKGDIYEPIFNVFHSEILKNCYLYLMPDCVCGATSCNLRIYVNNYIAENNNSTKDESVRGAIYVTLLHEMAHYFRRIRNIKRYDFLTRATPPLAGEARGEAGNQFETVLFGEILSSINSNAAKILIKHENRNLEDFQRAFRSANMEATVNCSSVVTLKSPPNGIKIPPCGMPYISFKKN